MGQSINKMKVQSYNFFLKQIAVALNYFNTALRNIILFKLDSTPTEPCFISIKSKKIRMKGCYVLRNYFLI
ncbi:MAG: hypothetical protein LBL74_02175 [Bacteroidales bacterium]|nr:hypothetical protein [Bacteroidales bacterium]